MCLFPAKIAFLVLKSQFVFSSEIDEVLCLQ